MAKNVTAVMKLAMQYERDALANGTHPMQIYLNQAANGADWEKIYAAPPEPQPQEAVRK